MKRLLSVIWLMLFCTTLVWGQLTSNDPYWIGTKDNFYSTEDNDFWVAFMNNAMFNPAEPNLQDIAFELKFAVSARQNTHIKAEVGNLQIADFTVQADSTVIVDVDPSIYPQVYLWLSETTGYNAIHVYTEEPNKKFSCFNYSRNGERGESSRDATLILPERGLGKEYFVQTYYEDTYSSELAIVATEDETQVSIWPAYKTYQGVNAGQEIQITLNRGDAYLLASAQHQASVTKVDLSGSKICADKPIAVFNGNQQTSIPYHESNSKDYLSEQIIPITQWGTDFYLANLENTIDNYAIITAAYDNTNIEIKYCLQNGSTSTINLSLNKGQSTQPIPLSKKSMTSTKEMVIHTNHPTMCYCYTTSGGQNEVCTGDFFTQVCVKYGDPANALMPSWAHRVKSMNFFTHDLDPYVQEGATEPPSKYYVYLVTATDDVDKLKIDNVEVSRSLFTAFSNKPSMSYASIEVTNPTSHYHIIESTGAGFVGMVYALTDAQGYFYTLGYIPDPYRDSLFVCNMENVMSKESYDVQPRLNPGWYQRQWDEWMEGHERLDTVVVCDSSLVCWLAQTPIVKNTDPVDWYIYDVTGTEPTIYKDYSNPIASLEAQHCQDSTSIDRLYNWEYLFLLPDESGLEPKQRKPFMDFEVHAVLHKKHMFCELPDELDTIRTVVRVTRIYHDTVYQQICMGDTFTFFYDNMPNAGNLSITRQQSDSTLFIGDRTEGESTEDWRWKARPGENIYHREYETIFGCDSSMTLFLFVCDTFRQVDTLHLCRNEKITYLVGMPYNKRYRGVETTGAGVVIAHDTVDLIEAKTQYCACQLDPRYPVFEGCDSLFEVHIFVHDIYRDTIVDTMCYNANPDSAYVWPIQKGTKQMRITKDDPRMHYEEPLQAWVGYFSDTLRTTLCPECNNGRGCDSIQVLQLIIPKSYYFEEEQTICAWTYDPETRSQTPVVYQWEHHRNGAAYVELPIAGDYYDSCRTRFDCDSIYHIKLIYYEPQILVTSYTMANNQTYRWHGVTYGPYPELENDTILYFHDIVIDPKTGCEKIYRLELHVSNVYLFEEKRAICENDSLHWRNKVIVGNKWIGTSPYDIRLENVRNRVVYDSLLTIEEPQRDSVYKLTITQYATYNERLEMVNVCVNSLPYRWRVKDNQFGSHTNVIDIPDNVSLPFDTICVDTLHTALMGCDSIVRLPLRVHPIYDTLVVDSVCETEQQYIWQLRDKEGVHDQIISFPDDKRGMLWYYTGELRLTSEADCDSLVRLNLKIKPRVDSVIVRVVCPEELPVTYGGGKLAHEAGTFYDTLTSVRYGCDSVITFVLSVHQEIRDTIHVYRCDNGAPYSYTAEDAPNLQNLTEAGLYEQIFTTAEGCKRYVVVDLAVRQHSENDTTIWICAGTPYIDPDTHESHYRDTTYEKTLINAVNCDSIVTTHIVRCDTFNVPAIEDTLCETSEDWSWYVSDTYGTYIVDVPTRNLHQQVLDTMLSYTLHTACPSKCDSVVHLHRVVNPVTVHEYTQIWCASAGAYHYGEKGKSATESGDYIDTLITKNQYGCDSIMLLHLQVMDSIIIHVYDTVCDNRLPYTNQNDTVPAWRELTAPGVYPYTFVQEGKCDSLVILHLAVNTHSRKAETIYMCQGETYIDPDFDTIISTTDTTYTKVLTNAVGCDSIVEVNVRYGQTYSVHDPDLVLCEKSESYIWTTRDSYDSYTHPFVWGDLHGQVIDTILYDTLSTVKPFHCDSITSIHITIKPSVTNEFSVIWCASAGAYHYGEKGKSATESGDYIDTLITKNQYGCDSILYIHLRILDSIRVDIYDTICNNQLPYTNQNDTVPAWQGLMTSGDYPYTFVQDGKCDSLVILHLTINDTTRMDTTYYLCVGAVYADVDFPAITTTRDTSYVKRLTGANAAGCDSVVYVTVRFGETYQVQDPGVVLCEREGRYVWTTYDSHWPAGYTHVLSWDDLGEQPLDTTLRDTLHTVAPFYCDSITSVHITVNPTTYQTIWPVVCTEQLPYRSDPQGKQKWRSEVYNDTLRNHYGCDSILTVHLTVLDKILTPLHVELCDDQLPYNHPTEETRLHGLTMTGIYHDTIRSHLSGCDSILELTLVVHRTYPRVIDTTYISLCDDTAYHFKTVSLDTIYNVHREWATPDQSIMRYVLTGMDTTRFGCDSAVAHVVTVYPTYAFLQDTMVCQDRSNTHWTWTDEFGGAHGNIDISITEPGTRVYADTLKTQYGCDSVFGIRVRVAPTYYIHEQQTICQDERTDWQWRGYSGDKYGWGYERLAGDRHDKHRDSVYHHYIEGDSILPPGIYYDTARYETVDGCDSIYYLQLTILPAGHYIVDEVACENEKYHVFYSSDAYGQYTDTVFFQPITRMIDDTRKDTLYYERERHLTAVQGGCDSTVHYHLTVHPSYEYVTRVKVCWDDWYEWRGRQYYAAGVYYDSIPGGTEHWGCDSVYVLELFKKPISLIPMYDTICDNETYEHLDTLWYTNGTHSIVETMVWTPGMTIPQTYTDVIFKGTDGCDSVVYRYWLQINKTYLFDLSAEICSFETYIAEGHTFTGYEQEYDTDRYVLPYDTLLTDAYQTIHGCDSIYNLHARMYPTYRHRDTITICDDETADWRGHHYAGSMLGNVLGNGLPAGEHVFRDSLLTRDHGCDSIYELHLMVMPTYLFVDSITKCADEDLSWRSFNLDHVLPGEYFYYDSLTTVTYGCDSVYHLYLTVLDTTYEIRHDSICETETYDFHGVPLTEPGFYKDTTLNAWGCHHFTYLYLYVIEPTVPTAWADSICADDKSYELFYTYTGDLDPIGFTVTYDEFGHYYGFRDTTGLIETPDQLHTLILPMPWRDDDYHKYPRPDYYNIRLTLDNGVCTDSSLCSTDTSIVLSYPSWVTEQRFRDVIAILSTDYNGGYTFSSYQWFRNNEPIPGETLPYLYIPRGLEQDTTWYHVRVVRVGETQDFQTCPIRIYDDFGTDTIAPYMGYLSVVPTCISTSNPVVSILSRHKGQYRVYTMEGIRVLPRDKDYGEFTPQEAYPVRLDGLSAGWYIFQLWSDETPEEPYRAIKILIKEGDRIW